MMQDAYGQIAGAVDTSLDPAGAPTVMVRARDRRGEMPRVLGVLAAASVLLAGCGGVGAADDEVVLDLDTLQADTPEGQVQAQRAEQSYVAALGQGQAIGVTFADQVDAGELADDHVVVYLYDRQELALLSGALDATGAASLTSHDDSDFDATVQLVVDDALVSGTVSVADQQEASFTAPVATGTAGVYWAKGTDEAQVRCDWVVLDDDRQWGCVCTPPFDSPCCHMDPW